MTIVSCEEEEEENLFTMSRTAKSGYPYKDCKLEKNVVCATCVLNEGTL